MNIIICNDDIEILQQISQYCENICNADDMILTYTNSKMLLKYLLTKHPVIDLFLLELVMPQPDGLELKRQISNLYKNTNIIFISNHKEMMEKAFGKNVLGFFSKESYGTKLKDYIDEIRKDLRKADMIHIATGKKQNLLPRKNIIMIQADHVYTIVVLGEFYNWNLQRMETQKKSYRCSLAQWEQLLQDEAFFRVSRSAIVNFRYVKCITDRIILYSGDEVPIPQRKIRHVKTAYHTYYSKYKTNADKTLEHF